MKQPSSAGPVGMYTPDGRIEKKSRLVLGSYQNSNQVVELRERNGSDGGQSVIFMRWGVRSDKKTIKWPQTWRFLFGVVYKSIKIRRMDRIEIDFNLLVK